MQRDIDEKEHLLHLKRLQGGRDAIKQLRRATSLAPAFKHWQQRVERSLLKLFDEDHPYYEDFSTLPFSDGWPEESRKPTYLGASGLVSRVGLEPTTYGLKVR